MRHPIKPTWIAVMDSSAARFYALHHDADGNRRMEAAADPLESDLHRHSQDVVSDKPGRGFRAGNSSARHGMEPPHDYHKLEKHDFVHVVAARLKSAFDEHKFERLVVVAPVRSLGEMREALDDTVKKCVWREVGKDLVKLSDHDLWARLEPELREEIGSEA